MENWIVIAVVGGISGFMVVCMVVLYLQTRRKRRPPKVSNLREVAVSLGMQYEAGPERIKHTSHGGPVRQVEIIDVLSYASKDSPAYAEISEGKATTCIAFGNQLQELDADVVKRSIKATVEPSEKIEQHLN